MKRHIALVTVVLLLAAAGAGYSASIGVGAGLDPTGLILFNVTSEVHFGDVLGMRAELGFSTINVEGLMLLGGLLFVHQPVEILDPFAGVGIGVAVTKADGSSLTVEGAIGTHVALFAPVSAFIDIRYIVRFTAYGINSGPLYEAGLALHFR